MRTLGDATIVGSTISGNTSTGWHGGGIFATDGTVTIVDTEIINNFGAPETAGGLMVATFGAPVLVTLQDSTVTGNVAYGCQVEGGEAAVLTSLGGNMFSDTTCNPTDSDEIVSTEAASVNESSAAAIDSNVPDVGETTGAMQFFLPVVSR